MKKEDLNNTWCKATEENLKALISYGLIWYDYSIYNWSYLIIDNNKQEINARNSFWENDNNYKEIHLVDGKFQYVEDKPKNNFEEFNLTPIKKEWYKDENNKGKLIINNYGEIRVIKYIINNKVATHQQNLYYDSINTNGWRLMTNEEIDSYKTKE